MDIVEDSWTGCYDLGWQNILTPAAFAHPAKFSRGLIFRIVEHAIEEGWVQPGSTVLDPFGGVACGALPCLQYGLNYVGIELEEKFVTLARENIALWNARYAAHFPNWGSAQILAGDSRRLCEVVGAAGCVVSSPPYTNQEVPDWTKRGSLANNKEYDQSRPSEARVYGQANGQLGAMPPGDIQAVIASPPFAGNSGGRGEASRNGIDPALFDRHSGGMIGGMGDEPGNLGNLPMGNGPVIVSSPPYADGCTHTGGNDPHPEHIQGGKRGAYGVAVVSSPPFADSVGSDDPDKRGGLFRDEKRRNDTNLTGTYGETEGQLGGMKAGAVISSPPYETGGHHQHQMDAHNTNGRGQPGHSGGYADEGKGQLQGHGDTFWAAARLIVEQCYAILPLNSYAIWVVKNYIKAGREVDFTDQWQALCEACGFETVHVHRAMLVKHQGVKQGAMEGESVSKEVSHKSFFRRLSERRGSPPIDYETILCTRKAA